MAIARSAWPAGSPTATDSPRVEILRHLAAQVHGAPRDHRLGEVVGELLLGIGVARVERADAAVAHTGTRSERPAARRATSSGPAKSKLR